MVSLLLPVIYLAFISLGLPDALLGAAWPSMYLGLGAGLSWAGMISMIISAGTVVSSLASDALTARLGPGRVTAISVANPKKPKVLQSLLSYTPYHLYMRQLVVSAILPWPD